MYFKSNFASSSSVIQPSSSVRLTSTVAVPTSTYPSRFKFPYINNASNELYCISSDIKNFAGQINKVNLDFQKSKLSPVDLENFKKKVIEFSDLIMILKTRCINIYNKIKEELKKVNLNTSFVNIIYNNFEQKYGKTKGFNKLNDIDSVSSLSLDEIGTLVKNLESFSITLKSDLFIESVDKKVNKDDIYNKLNEIYLNLYKASSGINSFAKKIYYMSTTIADTEPVNCTTFELREFLKSLTYDQKRHLTYLNRDIDKLIKNLKDHIPATSLVATKIKNKSANLSDIERIIKSNKSFSNFANIVASKIQSITTTTSVNNNDDIKKSSSGKAPEIEVVSSVAKKINYVAKQLETSSSNLNKIVPPIAPPIIKSESCTAGLPLFGYAAIMPFGGYKTLYRAFNISGTWDHVPYGNTYYSNFRDIIQLNDGTFIAMTVDMKYIMANTTLFSGNWTILYDKGGITEVLEIKNYDGFNFLIKHDNVIKLCTSLADISNSKTIFTPDEYSNMYNFIQLKDGTLACVGYLKKDAPETVFIKKDSNAEWKQLERAPLTGVRKMIQLQNGTLAIVSITNKIFTAPAINEDWVEVPNSCCIIDLYQLNNGTFVGIGPDNNGLYITSDLNKVAWVKAALIEGVSKFIEYNIKPSTRVFKTTTILTPVNTFQTPINNSIIKTQDTINAAQSVKNYLELILNPNLSLPQTSTSVRPTSTGVIPTSTGMRPTSAGVR